MRNLVGFLLIPAAIVVVSIGSVGAGRLTIEDVHNAYQGWPSPVSITADSLGFQPGRFDLVIAVNQAVDGFISVEPGQMVTDCQWEYFNYRVIPDTNAAYDLGHETHLVAITGVASPNGTALSCYGLDDPMELATIRLWNSHSHTYECQFLPIRFFWRDCQDNILTNAAGDTAHTSNDLYDPIVDSTRIPYLQFPGFGLPDDTCQIPGVETTRDLICFNGGIDLACVDSVYSGVGDINLNGRAFEIADLVLFGEYFLNGVGVFTINPAAQIAATDVNLDGIVLSIPDLICMLRIISADHIVNPKPSPSAARASLLLTDVNGQPTLSLTSDRPIGAGYLKLVADNGSLLGTTPLAEKLGCGRIGDTTTVLLTDFSSMNLLDAGSHNLLSLDRSDITIAEIEIYDSEGQRITTDISALLPRQFELYQNYPNPFNPETNIPFMLREQTRWTLTILNTLGQTVKAFQGANKGRVDVVWLGDNNAGAQVSSGVYYYRLETQDAAETKAMVLLR